MKQSGWTSRTAEFSGIGPCDHADRVSSGRVPWEGNAMLWQKGRRSDNVEDAGQGGGSGGPSFGGRGLGIGGIILLAIIGLVFFKDPTALLGGGDPGAGQAPQTQSQPHQAAA